MPKKHHPRRGSLAYTPRKRAPRPKPRVRAWPADISLRLLGFAGYKAGMTHVFMVDDRKGSLTEGQEICVPATALDVSPLAVCAVRLYGSTTRGFNTLAEVWADDLSKDLARAVKLPKEYDQKKALARADKLVKEGKVEEFRVLAHTQPKLSGAPKKKPDLVEIQVGGGSSEDRWNYSRGLLGKKVRMADLFEGGEYVDVFAITKGKGFKGPVKRWGIKIQSRKVQKARRHVGAIGPWKPPRIMRSVPGYGQMGYHQRTEFNKRLLKLGEDGTEITPSGGFLRYGLVKGDFALVAGSIPGPTKRLVCLRRAIRRSPSAPTSPPSITHISTASQQGA